MVAKVFGVPDAPAYYEALFGVRPYALYALASDLVAGSDYAIGDDLMGGLPLVATGAPTDHDTYATTASGNFWSTPFTADALVDVEGPNTGCTLIGVGRRASGSLGSLITSHTGAFTATSLSLFLGSATLVQSIVQPNARVASLANDASRGTRFAMYAATVTPTETIAYERHASSALAASAATAFAAQAIGGGGAFQIGDSSVFADDWVDVSVAMFFTHKLIAAELDGIYAGLDAWLENL